MVILGSRNQYCINSKLTDISDKNKSCTDLIKSKGCHFFNRKEKLVLQMAEKLFDIEELKTEGKKCGGCPYFAARQLQEDAEIIFCPYNYLVETSIRESSEISLDNAIILIDEAHNIEDCCRSAGSTEINSKLLEIITNEIINGIKKSAFIGDVQSEFVNLMEIFKKFRDFSTVTEFNIKNFNSSYRIKKGKDIITELEKIGITKEKFMVFKNALNMISKHEECEELLDVNTMRFLKDIERILGMVLFGGTDSYAYCFVKYNTNSNENMKNKNIITYSYNFWLLDPSVMFLPLVSKAKSISLLSGTLTPFSSFSHELKYSFKHKLVAPHILRDEQVFVCNIKKGHLNRELCGTYNIAETFEYLDQIAKIVTDIGSNVSEYGGTLVFVPSYSFLYKLAERLKEVIVEPKDGGMAEFERKVELYKKKIKLKKPAIFLCVYRGKAAEGIDFRDEFARAVIAIGIPYPSIKDPQISLKKEYNDSIGGYNGKLWYEAQAFRAVNQALGRAIRHSNDWGSVFLLDSRYSDRRYENSLPSWVTKNIHKFETYNGCIDKFKSFLGSTKGSKV